MKASLWKYYKTWRWALRSLPYSIYFCFRYLPFRQAIHLPILFYKPHLRAMKGRVEIRGRVHFGMVELGRNITPLFPNSGFTFDNNGGAVTFEGKCILGNGSCLMVGPQGHLTVGDNVYASTTLRLACFNQITLHEGVRIGWETTIYDTDFHKLTYDAGGYSEPSRPIVIGKNCWLAYGCTVLKGTALPPYTTVSAKTVLNKPYNIPQRCVIGTDTTVRVKREGVWRNLKDDLIE